MFHDSMNLNTCLNPTPRYPEEVRKMSEKKTLYLCDPSKNKECKKNTCQIKCKLTKYVEFAKLDKNGKPVSKIVV